MERLGSGNLPNPIPIDANAPRKNENVVAKESGSSWISNIRRGVATIRTSIRSRLHASAPTSTTRGLGDAAVQGAVASARSASSSFRKKAASQPNPPVPLQPLDQEELVEAAHQHQSVGDQKNQEAIPDRSRHDLLVFATQIGVAGAAALDRTAGETFATIDRELGGKVDPATISSIKKAYSDGLEQVGSLLRSVDSRPGISGLSAAELQDLKSPDPKKAAAAKEVLDQALRKPMSSDQKEFLIAAKQEIQGIERECNLIAQKVVQEAIKSIRENPAIPKEVANKAIESLMKVERNIPAYIGDARAEMMHAQKEWSRTEQQQFPLTIESRQGQQHQVTSSFVAAGPPYSSALARNRPPDVTTLPNFFASSVQLPDGQQALSSTRSAVPVEFGIDDPIKRAKSTRANVEQILNHHTAEKVKNLLAAGAQSVGTKDQPIVLKYQQVLLLTPDRMRNLGSSLSQKIVYRADNERLLVEESIDANEYWNEQTANEPREVILNIDGKPTKVWIKYDIRTLNIPSNKLQEKLTSNPIKSMLAQHSKTDQTNQKALVGIKGDVEEATNNLQPHLTQLAHSVMKADPTEGFKLHSLSRKIAQKHHKRAEISSYVLQGKPVPPKLLHDWSKLADDIVKTATSERENLSEQGREWLDAKMALENIKDLYADVNELITTRAYMNPSVLDGNRYAIGSRVLLLGSLLDIASHFGCRSGKDRTGIQDDDAKQLAAETYSEGRAPSYLEVEKWPAHQNNRSVMHEQSGNAEFNPRANLGGMAWWNVGGARLTPRDATLAAERNSQYNKLTAGNAVFWRPRTTSPWKEAA